MIDVLIRRGKGHVKTGRMSGVTETETAVSQGKPRIAGHHQKFRRAKEGINPESRRAHGP